MYWYKYNQIEPRMRPPESQNQTKYSRVCRTTVVPFNSQTPDGLFSTRQLGAPQSDLHTSFGLYARPGPSTRYAIAATYQAGDPDREWRRKGEKVWTKTGRGGCGHVTD